MSSSGQSIGSADFSSEAPALVRIGAHPSQSLIGLIKYNTKEDEYWAHVSSQEELPIAAGQTAIPVVENLGELARIYNDVNGAESLADALRDALLQRPQLLHQMRLLVSLSDKRLYLDLSYLFSRTPHPESPGTTLCGCMPHQLTRHSMAFFENMIRARARQPRTAFVAADLIATYLIDKGLKEMLAVYAGLPHESRVALIENLIAPREIQQNEAKRRGHGAEALFAVLLEALGCKFVPVDKATNPMGSHDPNVSATTFEVVSRKAGVTFSFDLVILDESSKPRVCVQGLIQSSDPGQFGVDKSDQTVRIRERMDQFNVSDNGIGIELWGIVDGVGYSENKEGTINKMLRSFHEFIQIKSIYKAALGLHRLGLCQIKGICFDSDFYSEESIQSLSSHYVPDGVEVLKTVGDADPSWKGVRAGKATVFLI